MKKIFLPKYLSIRLYVVLITQTALGLLLAAAYAALLPHGAPTWPLVTYLALLLLVAAACWLFIFRPYRRYERMMSLFSEGYTFFGLTDREELNLTPATERLIAKVKAEWGASNLLKLSKRQAQYRALQNQINPHFLYNTLESIRSEALIAGLLSVADMTEALAVFFRYTISKVETLVSVEEELQNCETYFHIQQYRFGTRLQLEIDCAPEDKDTIYRCRLPKLTLQPILENSIIHGTEFKIGTGHLAVRLSQTAENLLIQVCDDGVGMDESTLARLNDRLSKSSAFPNSEDADRGGSVALTNVNNRIRLIFGEEYGLHIYSMPGIGTDTHISLPLITSDREVASKEVLP